MPGGNLLLPFLVAVACVVGMIIALGLELGVLYDYRLRDFKAVTDDTAFAYNNSQCLGYASAGMIKTYYGTGANPEHFDCKNSNHKKDLGMLMSASVHGLRHNKDNNGGVHEAAFKAARHVSGVKGYKVAVPCKAAVEALDGVAGMSPRLNRVTCNEIYGVQTQGACTTALTTLDTAAPPLNTEIWNGIAEGKAAALAKVQLAKGVEAANAQVAADAGGTVGDGGDGDAAVDAAAITNLASAEAASAEAGTAFTTAFNLVGAVDKIAAGVAAANIVVATEASGSVGDGGVGDTAVANAAITDLASAQAADTARGDGLKTVENAYTAAFTATDAVYDATDADQVTAYEEYVCPPTVDDLHLDTPDGKTTLYSDIILESTTATENAAYTTAAGDATQTANLVALENIYDWNLYLQCTLVGGLGNVGPVTTADSLAPVPTSSRGGTLGVPLYQHSSTDECVGVLKPAITVPPAPYADFNCTKPRQARAKVMYGLRLGWSLYATVPCLILIIYLGVDAIMAAICFWSRRMALQEQERSVSSSDPTLPVPGVPTSLATLAVMRRQRIGLALVGFLIVLILKALYDWAPWSTGTILPQARGCASDGTGWDTEQTATTMHFVVIILLLAVIIALPLSQFSILSEVFSGLNDGGKLAVDDEKYYNVDEETGRLFLWFVIVTLGGIVIIGLEAADGTTFGIAWAQRQLAVASTADLTLLPVDEAATLVETATTSAVLASVTAGATIALVYARWLFSSYGKVNLVLWFVWGGCVIAAFIPLFITWGFKINLDPDSQDVIDKCDQLNVDSFEKGLCEYRVLVFSIAVIAMLGVFAIMWCCWFKSAAPAAMQAEKKGEAQEVSVATNQLGVDTQEKKAAFRSEKIPLLSLRVRA